MRPRAWLLPVVIVAIIAHAVLLYRVSSHVALGTAGALAIVLAAKHLGFFGARARAKRGPSR